MKSIQKEVKKWVFENRKSIDEAAQQSNLTNRTLYNIFNSNDLKVSQLKNISKTIGVDMKFWFEMENTFQNNTNNLNENSFELKNLMTELLKTQLKIVGLQEQLSKFDSTKKR